MVATSNVKYYVEHNTFNVGHVIKAIFSLTWVSCPATLEVWIMSFTLLFEYFESQKPTKLDLLHQVDVLPKS